MTHTQPTTPEKLRLRSVAWQHFVELLDAHGLRAAARFVGLFLLASGFSWLALYPENAEAAFVAAVTWRDYALPTCAWIFAATFGAPSALRFIRDAVPERAPAGDTIEGMDVEKVIAHLQQHRTFKRDDVERAFGVPRYRYTALVQKLKKLGVLVPGVNNMSVLSDEWTADELRGMFAGCETAAELSAPVRIVRPAGSPPLFRSRALSSESPMETDEKPSGNPCATACAA